MKILINTASSFKGGGIQTSKSFIEECRNFDNNDYCVVLSKNLSNAIDVSDFSKNFTFYTGPFRPATKVFSFQSHNYFLKEIERKFNPDIVFSIGGPSYWRPKTVHLMGYTIPHYIYEESHYFKIIPLKRKLWWKAMKIYAKYVFKRDADALVVQTDDVNNRVKKFLGKSKVYTVHNTINKHYLKYDTFKNKLAIKKADEFRLLTLSAWYPHKNLSIIREVIKLLNNSGYNSIKFIVTLPDIDFKKLNINSENFAIINVGPVRIEEAPSLYNECDAMFLPTLLECFSASYVESMKMKKPILTSDMGFSRTVCNNAAIYFDPMNANDIASKIISLFNSKELQDKLIKNGKKRLGVFGSAKERARHYHDICDTLVKQNTNKI